MHPVPAYSEIPTGKYSDTMRISRKRLNWNMYNGYNQDDNLIEWLFNLGY